MNLKFTILGFTKHCGKALLFITAARLWLPLQMWEASLNSPKKYAKAKLKTQQKVIAEFYYYVVRSFVWDS